MPTITTQKRIFDNSYLHLKKQQAFALFWSIVDSFKYSCLIKLLSKFLWQLMISTWNILWFFSLVGELSNSGIKWPIDNRASRAFSPIRDICWGENSVERFFYIHRGKFNLILKLSLYNKSIFIFIAGFGGNII